MDTIPEAEVEVAVTTFLRGTKVAATGRTTAAAEDEEEDDDDDEPNPKPTLSDIVEQTVVAEKDGKPKLLEAAPLVELVDGAVFIARAS